MKATILHNQEKINIDTENIEVTQDELISVCVDKINEYYRHHKNKIIIGNAKLLN